MRNVYGRLARAERNSLKAFSAHIAGLPDGAVLDILRYHLGGCSVDEIEFVTSRTSSDGTMRQFGLSSRVTKFIEF